MDISKIKLTNIHLKFISTIDEFKGRWTSLSSIPRERLEALRKVATVQSAGSSTRIEGAKLSDEEVESLLSKAMPNKLKNRDEAEVKGYADVMDMITESYRLITITENHIKQIHQTLLRYSEKDSQHRGVYKNTSNTISAFNEKGEEVGVILETCSPFETPEKMRALVQWYNDEVEREENHPLILIAVFIVYLLAIHPFQDGNGRVSRALTTLLLLRSGYTYIQYSSMERVIENSREEYYLSLRRTQSTLYTTNEKINEWVLYFLKIMHRQVQELDVTFKQGQDINELPPLSIKIINLAKKNGKVTISDVSEGLGVNRNTIKKHLARMVEQRQIKQLGKGKGTWYQLP